MSKLKNKISAHISRQDIKYGIKNNPCLCPIALAICDKYHLKPKKVYISPESTIFNGDEELYYKLSDDSIQFMLDFDAGKYVDEITVEANLVRKYER